MDFVNDYNSTPYISQNIRRYSSENISYYYHNMMDNCVGPFKFWNKAIINCIKLINKSILHEVDIINTLQQIADDLILNNT